MARSGRESHPVGQEWLEGPPEGLGGVGRPSWRDEKGAGDGRRWEVHPEGREGSGGPSGWQDGLEALPIGQRGDGSPTRGAGRGCEVHPEGWQVLGEPEEVESPTHRARRGCEALQKGPEGS